MKYPLILTPLVISLFACFIYNNSYAQAPGSGFCYTDQLWAEMVKHDSSLLVNRKAMDDIIAPLSNEAVNNNRNGSSRDAATATVIIPTVIYIVHDGTPATNISMEQIQSQMDQLNEHFSSYGYRFCYARKNITDTARFAVQAGDSIGVFRIQSPATNTDMNSGDAQLKALSTLSSVNYLRIFVVKNIIPANVLGYATLPGGPAQRDGIVMRYDGFGSDNYCNNCNLYPRYNLGAALTHEVGHYLNLYHTFQGGCYEVGRQFGCVQLGDQICDTPPTEGSFGCPSPAPLSCDGVNKELIANYMDYTEDACKSSFTPGQKSRMDYTFTVYRAALISSENLINTGVSCVSLSGSYTTIKSDNFSGCTNDTMFFSSINAGGFTYRWDFGDGDTAVGASVSHVYRNSGRYQVSLLAESISLGLTQNGLELVIVTDCHPIICGYNKWDFTFGYLDFSSGKPIALNHSGLGTEDSPLYYYYAHRGDKNGNSLFHLFSFGKVFDASCNFVETIHTQGTTICLPPVPGNNNKFCYIHYSPINGVFAMRYCIMDGNNGGAVLPGKKNILMQPSHQLFVDNLSKAITAVPNCDGSKFWIVVYIGNGTLDVFELNSNDTLIRRGSYTIPDMLTMAVISASPNGRKLLMTGCLSNNQKKYSMYTLDFDKASGTITSHALLDEGTPLLPVFSSNMTQSTFSPNSRFVYARNPCCYSATSEVSSIYQYDLRNANPAASKKLVTQFLANGALPITSMRIGPDKKVYLGYIRRNDNRGMQLSVINYPNELEDGLNAVGFIPYGPAIRPKDASYNYPALEGFSQFIDAPDAYDCSWQPDVPPMFSYQATSCNSHKFFADDCFSNSWNFGDTLSGVNNTSTLAQPVHSYSKPGTYVVRLNTSGTIYTDTVRIAVPSVQLTSTGLQSCPILYGNYSVANVAPGVSYNWTITNGLPTQLSSATNADIQWNGTDTAGQIKIVATNTLTGCADTSTFVIKLQSANYVVANVNARICKGETYVFGNKYYTQAGTYADTIAGPGGCDTILSLQLTRDTVNTTIVLLSPDSLYVPASGKIKWINCSANMLLPNDTFAYYTSAIPGAFAAIIFDGTCTDTTRCVQLGVTEALQAEKDEIHIFPNPANDQLWLITTGAVPDFILLYDIDGNRVSEMKFEKNINIAALPAGVYIIELKSSSSTTHKRFIKL